MKMLVQRVKSLSCNSDAVFRCCKRRDQRLTHIVWIGTGQEVLISLKLGTPRARSSWKNEFPVQGSAD